MKEQQYLSISGGPIDTSVPSKHGELNFIKDYPDLIHYVFEYELKNLKNVGKDNSKYIEKLLKLRRKLDELIIKWV